VLVLLSKFAIIVIQVDQKYSGISYLGNEVSTIKRRIGDLFYTSENTGVESNEEDASVPEFW
jgi:hypothetical protein